MRQRFALPTAVLAVALASAACGGGSRPAVAKTTPLAPSPTEKVLFDAHTETMCQLLKQAEQYRAQSPGQDSLQDFHVSITEYKATTEAAQSSMTKVQAIVQEYTAKNDSGTLEAAALRVWCGDNGKG